MKTGGVIAIVGGSIAAILLAYWIVNKMIAKGGYSSSKNADTQAVQALITAQLNGGYWSQGGDPSILNWTYAGLQKNFLNDNITSASHPTASTNPSDYDWGNAQSIFNAAQSAAKNAASKAGKSGGTGINWSGLANAAIGIAAKAAMA